MNKMKKRIELSPMTVTDQQRKNTNSNSSSSTDGAVRVVVRVRPLLQHEVGEKSVIRCQENTIQTILNRIGNEESVRSFTYNNVLSPLEDQGLTFEKTGVKLLMNQALQGTNVSILAYGQTGSGKTYSMSGMIDETISSLSTSPSNGSSSTSSDSSSKSMMMVHPQAGIIPRACIYLFKRIQEINNQRIHRYPNLLKSSSSSSSVTIRASYCEIFNENCYDLLNLTGQALTLRYIPNQGFFIAGQVIVTCENASELMEVIKEGSRNRSVSSHSLNMDSSRSHSLLTIWIERKISTVSLGTLNSTDNNPSKHNGTIDELFDDPDDPSFTILRSKIIFVDLAGSERLKDSQSEGVTATETRYINKSLFVLGKVIAALSEKKPSNIDYQHNHNTGSTNKSKLSHIPYRDSKLTQLLADSLGGTARTLLLSCVSPAAAYLDETLQTLQYSLRASRIENAPIIRVDAPHVNQLKTIKLLQQENERLKTENQLFRTMFELSAEDIVTQEVLDENIQKLEERLSEKLRESLMNDSSLLLKDGDTASHAPATIVRPPPRRPTLPSYANDNATAENINPSVKGRGRSRKRSSMVGQHNGRQVSVETKSVTEQNENNNSNSSLLSFPTVPYGQPPRLTSHVADRIAQRAGSKLVIDVQQAELDALTAERNSLLTKHTAAKARINSLLTNINEYKTIINNLKNELDTNRKGRMDLEHYMLSLQQQQPVVSSSAQPHHRATIISSKQQSLIQAQQQQQESSFIHDPQFSNAVRISSSPRLPQSISQNNSSLSHLTHSTTDEVTTLINNDQGTSSYPYLHDDDASLNVINFQNISSSITNHPSVYSNSQIPAYNHRRISQPAPSLRLYHEYPGNQDNNTASNSQQQQPHGPPHQQSENYLNRPSGTAPP